MKISCEIAEDLLPLYLEDTCSKDSRAALEEQDTLSGRFLYGGGEYYFCLTSLIEYDTLLLFLIPAEYVAPGTVNMVGTTIRTLLFLAVGMVAMLVLAVAAAWSVDPGFRRRQYPADYGYLGYMN